MSCVGTYTFDRASQRLAYSRSVVLDRRVLDDNSLNNIYCVYELVANLLGMFFLPLVAECSSIVNVT